MEIGVDKEQVDRDSDKDRCGHRAIVDRGLRIEIVIEIGVDIEQ